MTHFSFLILPPLPDLGNGGRFGTGHIQFGPILQALEDIEYEHFGSVKVYRRAEMDEAIRSSIEILRRAAP